ncbi:NmrA family protein [Colletotrichum musicola]|uniref:NmrA family protein n=1 Tax=Colletotrichum musicola TaxID=2175873 RepID=A0A8H6KIU7_9PEZI|nr:NmrA family protein [Colletotrichum musicola]
MQIVVVPASPKTGQATIRALLDDPSEPAVTGVYRDPGKAPADFREHPRFRIMKGDVADVGSLDFSGVDAVVTITPPQYSQSKPITRAREMAANVKYAIGRAGDSLKRVVYVSSVGAQLEHGTGEIKTNYEAEQALIGAAPEVVFVRCAYFMENWATALETVKAEPPFFYSVISPSDYKIPMVSVRDIGRTCAAQILAAGSPLSENPYIFDLHGPETYSTQDVQKALEEATGKDVEARVVEDDQLEGFFAEAFKPPMAGMFVEMTRSFLPRGVGEKDMNKGFRVQRGRDTLGEVLKRMMEQ